MKRIERIANEYNLDVVTDKETRAKYIRCGGLTPEVIRQIAKEYHLVPLAENIFPFDCYPDIEEVQLEYNGRFCLSPTALNRQNTDFATVFKNAREAAVADAHYYSWGETPEEQLEEAKLEIYGQIDYEVERPDTRVIRYPTDSCDPFFGYELICKRPTWIFFKYERIVRQIVLMEKRVFKYLRSYQTLRNFSVDITPLFKPKEC